MIIKAFPPTISFPTYAFEEGLEQWLESETLPIQTAQVP